MSPEEGDGFVLLGAFAFEGGLGAGELSAQGGDGVVRGGEPGGGGGEFGGVLLPVPLAAAFRAAARVFRGGDGGRGGGALAVAFPGGAAGEFFGLLACPGLGFHLGDGLGGGGAGLGGAELGGVPGRCAGGGPGAGLFQLGCGLGADCLGLGFGGLGVTGRGELPAEDGELVQRGGQLRAEPGHRGQRVVADGARPADRGGDRPVLAGLPGELLPAPERGQRSVPDRHHRAVASVLGDFPPAVAGPPARRVMVPGPGRAAASRIPARSRLPGHCPGRRLRGDRHRAVLSRACQRTADEMK